MSLYPSLDVREKKKDKNITTQTQPRQWQVRPRLGQTSAA